jgi:tetratricopeptide (TPR) repeat protein
MLKNIIIGIISIVLLLSTFINFKVYKSLIQQNGLVYEFNANQTKTPLAAVKTFIDDIPNITGTTLPIKMLKARYYLKNSQYEKALELLHKSNKENPFLGINDILIAEYHYKQKNIDSAFYYSKKAFEALPRNDVHSKVYFLTLAKLKKDSLLDISFQKIKENYILPQWRDYLFSKIEIGETPKEELISILEEAKAKISDKKKLNTLETVLKVGSENLDELGKIIIEAEKSYKQNYFLEAANLYQKAARIDDSEYTHYENAALSYYRGDYFEEAERLFKYTLRNFKGGNGKTEFYLGLLMYELEKKDKACEFWKISRQKGFSGPQKVIETFCK